MLANTGQITHYSFALQGKKEDGEEESSQKDKFEENYRELTKWVDVKLSKFCTLTVLREKRLSRPGTALKVKHVYLIVKFRKKTAKGVFLTVKKLIDNGTFRFLMR